MSLVFPIYKKWLTGCSNVLIACEHVCKWQTLQLCLNFQNVLNISVLYIPATVKSLASVRSCQNPSESHEPSAKQTITQTTHFVYSQHILHSQKPGLHQMYFCPVYSKHVFLQTVWKWQSHCAITNVSFCGQNSSCFTKLTTKFIQSSKQTRTQNQLCNFFQEGTPWCGWPYFHQVQETVKLLFWRDITT